MNSNNLFPVLSYPGDFVWQILQVGREFLRGLIVTIILFPLSENLTFLKTKNLNLQHLLSTSIKYSY